MVSNAMRYRQSWLVVALYLLDRLSLQRNFTERYVGLHEYINRLKLLTGLVRQNKSLSQTRS